jgi:hypothetical protein
METKLILLLVLGISLILGPSAVGVRYLKEWRSDTRRLERRFRELEW